MLKFFRPHILHYYIVTEYLKNFGLAMLACTIVMMLGTFVLWAAEFEDFGISVGQIAMLSPLFLPYALGYAFPLAAMIAAILVFGRLAAENEILAAQSGGASIGMLATWVIFCGAICSAVALYCGDIGIQWGFSTLRDQVLNLKNPDLLERIEKPGSNLSLPLEDGRTVQINMLHREQGVDRERRPIHIAYFERGSLVRSLYASDHTYSRPEKSSDRQSLRMKIVLIDGQSLGENPQFFQEIELVMTVPLLDAQLSLGRSRGTVSWRKNYQDAQKLRESVQKRRRFLLDRAAELGAQAVAGSPADPAAPVLAASAWVDARAASDLAAVTWEKIQREMVEFHRKLSLAAIPFSMVFLGIGLGLLVRKGHRLVGFILGILTYVLVYYPLMVVFKEIASRQLLPPWFLWAPNVLLFLLGLLLWAAHEYGYLTGGVPAWLWLRRLRPLREFLIERLHRFARPLAEWHWSALLPFRRQADRHVARSFLAPFLTVALGVAVLFVLLDLVEHGTEVVRGVYLANEPVAGLPVRSFPRAVVDVLVYYAIRGMRTMFDLLPAILLIAGVLAVTIMVRNNEHLIFKSAGARLQRAFRPIILSAVFLSVFVLAVRETVMPSLLMEVDRLKPMIYHRNPKSRSIAGQTLDGDGKPVIYEIARYVRNTHICENLRIYLPSQAENGRIPRVIADRAEWDDSRECWRLQTLAEEGAGSSPDKEKPEKAAKRYLDHGLLIRPVAPEDPGHERALHLACTEVRAWSGSLTPAFLESEALGPGVMRLSELWAVRHLPEFKSELWRRAFEPLTGFLLLMVTIPLLVRQEIRSPLVGVAKCIGYGVAYLGMGMAAAEASRQDLIPSWSPFLPHLLFLALGLWRYVHRMET